jgi:hypothetical protein
MRPEFEKYSTIDDYLNGKLSDQENTAFEKSMSEDKALREEVFDRKVVNEIIIEKRFFDIASGLRTAPTGPGSLISSSLKRFVGIGAAVIVILYTPYYFSKQSEQAVQNTTSPEKKDEPAKVPTATTQEQDVVMLEEQNQENRNTEPATEEPTANTTTEEHDEMTVVTKKSSVAKKKKAKSYILEIPIDDPSAKGHSANSYSFSISKGQSWKIPVEKHSQATLTIFTKEGDEVFSSVLNTAKTNSWNGISNDGVKQKAGKYAYLLDFGKGNIEHGHVTINP